MQRYALPLHSYSSNDDADVNVAQNYPIPNTKQGIPLPILRHNAHLRARKDEIAAVLRVRSEMNWAMSDYFRVSRFQGLNKKSFVG